MKYETPELNALTPAINAIQITSIPKSETFPMHDGSTVLNDLCCAYEDWE